MQLEIIRRALTVRNEAEPVRGSGRTPRRWWRALLPAFVFGTLATPAAGEKPIELPTLPGCVRAATLDLNNRGQMVGYAFAGGPAAPMQAILWRRHWWKPLTVEPLPALPNLEDSVATAISRDGIPLGYSSIDFQFFRAVVWKKGPAGEWEACDLEPPPGFTDAVAAGVNARGEMVGLARNSAEGVDRAVLWTRQRGGGYSVVELETPDGFQSRATAINERGDVVGMAFRTELDGTLRSDIVVWRRLFSRRHCGTRSPVVLTPVPGLPTSREPAINLRGDVVARAEVRVGGVTTTRPVLWKRHRWSKRHWNTFGPEYGDPIELPMPEGFTDASATDINVFGRVVGWASEGLEAERAVTWSRDRRGHWTVNELDSPEGGLYVRAVHLNDLGHTVGNDLFALGGGTGALLWEPPGKLHCRKTR